MSKLLEPSYFDMRLSALGIDPKSKDWNIELYNPDAEFPMPDTTLHPIFSEDDKGNIRILVYDIEQEIINYFAAGDGKMSHINGKIKPYYVTRLKTPLITKSGDSLKYLMPKGEGTFPFFPPNLCKKFKDKTPITTLFLTEGYFKASKASMHGFDIIGLSSITHMCNTKTGELHGDIKKIIIECKVQNVIWMVDGDCLNLSTKDIENADLYRRPSRFFQTANKFKDLMSEFDIKKYFSHVISESFPADESKGNKEYPKGLDDALVSVPGAEQLILQDALNLSKPGMYFFRQDITFSIGKLYIYFNLNDVTNFYLYHVERYPDLKDREFKWNGTKYKYNDEKQVCEIIIPAEASNYFRVGDQYHSWVYVPNKYSDLERRFERRQKSTIADDHGKTIFKHIAKYQAFCNVPDHNNFQPVINNCFNVYSQFEHEPEEGDFPQTAKFLKHIFGENIIHWRDPKNGEKMEITEYELGLDYVTLLYKKPTQILPILCLVSRENNTGKSTFAQWLKLIFTQNAAIIGNAELVDNFNASWATKLIICCDETKIDKQEVVEKVKRLSTADKIMMNSKGKDHVELDFFGKFIFLSNNEENFIYASDDDVRYWIRKVPIIRELNVSMMEDLKNEIPAFLHFMNQRKIVTPRRHRGWFHPDLIKTDALKKVIQYSMPTIEKEIRSKIRAMFLDFGVDEIKLSPKDIKDDWFKHRFEDNYIEDTLKHRMKLTPYHKYEYKEERYETIEALLLKHPNLTPDSPEIKKRNLVTRYSIPAWENVPNAAGHMEMTRVNRSRSGRPYIFKAVDFLTHDELDSRASDPEFKRSEELLNDEAQMSMDLDKDVPKAVLPF